MKLISSNTAEKTAQAFNLFSDEKTSDKNQLKASENLSLFSQD